MENNEKKDARQELEIAEREGRSLKAQGKMRKRENTTKINKLWIWLGVLLLIFILLWWLMSIGMFEDLTGVSNG